MYMHRNQGNSPSPVHEMNVKEKLEGKRISCSVQTQHEHTLQTLPLGQYIIFPSKCSNIEPDMFCSRHLCFSQYSLKLKRTLRKTICLDLFPCFQKKTKKRKPHADLQHVPPQAFNSRASVPCSSFSQFCVVLHISQVVLLVPQFLTV